MAWASTRRRRTKIWAALGLSGLAVLSVGGCVGSPNEPGAGGGAATRLSPKSFAKIMAQTYCESIAGCCASAGNPVDACENTVEATYTADFDLDLISPKIVFDGIVAAHCLDATRSALLACIDRALNANIVVACDGLIHGTVPEGGSCATSGECTAHGECDAGACAPSNRPRGTPSHAMAGDPCFETCTASGSYDACLGPAGGDVTLGACWIQDGLYCGASATCLRSASIGEPCADSSYCEDTGHCANGTCVADSATGPCTSGDQCASGSYCDGVSGQCVPAKANGSPCATSSECAGGQCDQAVCRDWSVATVAACAGWGSN